ncbi:MAG: hypothetical protein V8Q57_08500 [Blautia sp.]
MIDSKQFIVMDVPFEKEDFLHITLSNDKILSYHKDLHIEIVKDETGNGKICLLGWAFQVAQRKKKRSNRGNQTGTGRGESGRNSGYLVLGRWLLIYEGSIYLDACGLFGCFYTKDGILSSSLNCINQALKRKNVRPGIRHGFSRLIIIPE